MTLNAIPCTKTEAETERREPMNLFLLDVIITMIFIAIVVVVFIILLLSLFLLLAPSHACPHSRPYNSNSILPAAPGPANTSHIMSDPGGKCFSNTGPL